MMTQLASLTSLTIFHILNNHDYEVGIIKVPSVTYPDVVYYDLKFLDPYQSKFSTVFECLVFESALNLLPMNDKIKSLLDRVLTNLHIQNTCFLTLVDPCKTNF